MNKINIYVVIVLLILIEYMSSQQYPSCNGGSPSDIGNVSSIYSTQILSLTNFIGYNQTQLAEAFSYYLQSSSEEKVNNVLQKNKSFYIILTILLSFISLVLFVILIRMGDLQLTTKQNFQKIKEKGYSSPLAAFFTLTAVTLLSTTAFNAYVIPSMINNLSDTECRMDNVNTAFLEGSHQYGWDGVNKFTDKLNIVKNISKSLHNKMEMDFELLLNNTQVSGIFLQSLKTQYNGIKDQFKNATVIENSRNTSQNIDLTTLIPNLFTNTTATTYLFEGLDNNMLLMKQAQTDFQIIEHLLNDTYLNLNGTAAELAAHSSTLQNQGIDFSLNYYQFRAALSSFFQSSLYILIVCEFITGVTVVGCLISIFSMRLIQSKYDYFSLKIYKVIWACHIIVFCLNLIFLLLFNTVSIYSEGVCLVANDVLSDKTKLSQILPKLNKNGGLSLFHSCLFSQDFTIISKTKNYLSPTFTLTQMRQKLNQKYSNKNLGQYPPILSQIQQLLLPYKFGYKGNYTFLNLQLDTLNNITLNNPFGQNCFKHHWELTPQKCYKNQPIILLPTTSFMYINYTNFGNVSSVCYVLNDYTNVNPSSVHASTFFNLYANFITKCPLTISALGSAIKGFLHTESKKQQLIDNLISQVYSLSPFYYNLTSQMLNYTTSRKSFIKQVYDTLPSIPSSSYLSQGNDCSVIQSYVQGVYNQFCVNFRANAHVVYLMVICNLGYSTFLIFLSFLYAIQLKSIENKDEQMSEGINFQKTFSPIVSENNDSSHLSFSQCERSSQNRSQFESQSKGSDQAK